nr:RhuM family protein [uncultured Eubacterium sp.]
MFDEDYFEHLVAEIQKIKSNERRFCQKNTDIYATAVDYDKNSQVTRDFYAMVQKFKIKVRI